MPVAPRPPEALADLYSTTFEAMQTWMRAHAAAAALAVLEDTRDRLTVQTAQGVIGLRRGTQTDVAIMVGARDARWLHMMKSAMVHELRARLPQGVEALRWSDAVAAGGLPPNFQFVTVIGAEALGSAFIRLTLQGEDFSSHDADAIHFRLMVPRKGVAPVWPHVAANGATVWPDGPGAPDRPVYTTRHLDHAANIMVTDVFVHDGGHTAAWAQELLEGERARAVVGLVGPSGAGVLQADHVLMASDETGFPAAARILEALPKGASGTMLLEAKHGAACGYPIKAPPSIDLRWLARSHGDSLAEATIAALPDHSGAVFWYAGEKADAQAVRDVAKAIGWDRHRLRASGFWSKNRKPKLG